MEKILTIENKTIGLILGFIAMMILIGFRKRMAETIMKVIGIDKLKKKKINKKEEI